MSTDPIPRPLARPSRAPGPTSAAPSLRSPRSRRPRRVAALTALALVSASLLAFGAPTAGADEPYLPQDVGLFGEVNGCELHLGALAEVKTGAELRIVVVGPDPVEYRNTLVVGYDGLVDEVLEIGRDVMPGAGGGTALGMALVFEGVLIDDFAAPIPEVASCDDLVPLAVGVDATGQVPAAVDLQIEVRTGECGNTQIPAAVIAGTAGETVTVLAAPGATCPSPVDALGATMSYLPDQQTQVEEIVGAAVTVVFGFPDPPADTTTTTALPTATPTTATSIAPIPATRQAASVPAATPVAVSPSFTG